MAHATTTGSNIDRIRAVHELRRSGAAGRHTPKPRKGSRAARKRAAIAQAW